MKKNIQLFGVVALTLLLTCPLFSQTGEWKTGYNTPGIGGYVFDAKMHDGILYVSGDLILNELSERYAVAKFENNTWQPVGGVSGAADDVKDIAWIGDDLYMSNRYGLNMLVDNEWTVVQQDLGDDTKARIAGFIAGLHYDNGNIHVFGTFSVTNTDIKNYAIWNGSEYSGLGKGFNGGVSSVVGSGNSMYIGGSFRSTADESKPLRGMAYWNGSELTEPFSIPESQYIYSLALVVNEDQDSILYATGANSYTSADENVIQANWVAFQNDELRVPQNEGQDVNIPTQFSRVVANGNGVIAYNVSELFHLEEGVSYTFEKLTDSFDLAHGLILLIPIENGFIWSGYHIASFDRDVAGAIIRSNSDFSQWTDLRGEAISHGFYGSVSRIFDFQGSTYIVGDMIYSDLSKNIEGMAKLGDSGWEAVPNATRMTNIYSVLVTETDVHIGGAFTDVGPNSDIDFLISYNGTEFYSPTGESPNNSVMDLDFVDETLFISGVYSKIGTTDIPGFTGFKDNEFITPGITVEPTFTNQIQKATIEVLTNGSDKTYKYWLAGNFTNFNGSEDLDKFIYFDGSEWTKIGGEMNGLPTSFSIFGTDTLLSHTFGANVVVDGQNQTHYLSNWDGSQWNAVVPNLNRGVDRLVETDSGIYVFSNRFAPFGSLGFYNGTSVERMVPHDLEAFQTRDFLIRGDSMIVVFDGDAVKGTSLAVFAFGEETGTSVEQIESPTDFVLGQNYPNPFNPTTTIPFRLSESGTVELGIYSILGQNVSNLISQQRMSAGQHNISFDASSLASGVYIYRLTIGTQTHTKRMMIIK